MIVRCIVNGKNVEVNVAPHETLRKMLLSLGHFAVRDSDDGEGFAGSDTVIFNDRPLYSNLLLAA
jgi:putative selenate reductase molybdopterin-binding subunit